MAAGAGQEEGVESFLIRERPVASPTARTPFSRPNHLIVLVNGILASANDWSYAGAQLKKRLGSSVLVYPSSSNSYLLTLQGIDVAGERLAEEIQNVVARTPGLRKISFVAHSLGGLFVRYAIGRLYSCAGDTVPASAHTPAPAPAPAPASDGAKTGSSAGAEGVDTTGSRHESQEDIVTPSTATPTLAGLEPGIFVSLATPHLGIFGNKQLPILLGLTTLEKMAAPVAPFFIGRTGTQLFLRDVEADKLPVLSSAPLLVRMARDCAEGAFISALRFFRLRVLYANVGFDHLVGWRTSSIRRETELPDIPYKALNSRYRHVVHMEDCPAMAEASSSKPIIDTSPEASSSPRGGAAVDKGAAKLSQTSKTKAWEEEMISGLQQVPWRKVDVDFRAAYFPFMAHNFIHVKTKWIHFEGAGVIKHLIDMFVDQEERIILDASL